MMPFGQFNAVVISVSQNCPLTKVITYQLHELLFQQKVEAFRMANIYDLLGFSGFSRVDVQLPAESITPHIEDSRSLQCKRLIISTQPTTPPL